MSDIVERLREALDAVQNFRGDLDSDDFEDACAGLRFHAAQAAPELLAEIERLRAQVAALSAPAPAPAEAVAIEALAHRIAWRYKKSSDPNHSDTYTFNRATLLQFAAALAAPAAPAGWQLVPVEPTPDMRAAAVKAICYGPEGGFTRIAGPDRCWSAMLAAAPGAQGDAA